MIKYQQIIYTAKDHIEESLDKSGWSENILVNGTVAYEVIVNSQAGNQFIIDKSNVALTIQENTSGETIPVIKVKAYKEPIKSIQLSMENKYNEIPMVITLLTEVPNEYSLNEWQKTIEQMMDNLKTDIGDMFNIMNFRGVITPIEGSTFESLVEETIPEPIVGDVIIYGEKEYIYHDGKWVEFGDASGNANAIKQLQADLETVTTADEMLKSQVESLGSRVNSNAITIQQINSNISNLHNQLTWNDTYLTKEV